MGDEKATALDQTMALDPEEWGFVVNKVDEVLDQAQIKGPGDALEFLYGLRRGGHSRALAAAHMLYGLKVMWKDFETDDTFEDSVLQSTGYSGETTRKYTGVWKALFSEESPLDPEIQMGLSGKPMTTLELLPAAAKDDRFTKAVWVKILKAHDQQAVRAIVHATRGKKTNSETALVWMLDRDGSLKHRRGQRTYKVFGEIIRDGDEDTEELIERMHRIGMVIR